jgi:hypothetical protein
MATPALGAVLCPILVPQFPREARDLPADQDLATVEVDVGPAQPAHLTPPGAEHDSQDQEQSQLRVLGHGGVDEPLGLGDLGRLDVKSPDRWAGD